MKVMATQPGQYCNVFFEVGWVFELLYNEDGTEPQREDWIPKLDAQGKDTGDGEYVIWRDKDNKTIHRDLALDMGEKVLRSGPKRGEVARFGWMKIVPEETPVTIDIQELQYGFDADTRKPRRAPPRARPTPPAVPTPQRRAG